MEHEMMRLQKYLARCGVASRRAAEDMIRAGRVTVDGQAVTDMGRTVAEIEKKSLDGRWCFVRLLHLSTPCRPHEGLLR